MTTASKRYSQKLAWLSNCFYNTAILGLAVLGVAAVSAQSLAQSRNNGYRSSYQPKNHEFTRGDSAPGVAADIARVSNPRLQGHVQPVRVIVPDGASVGVRVASGYVETNASKTSVGLIVGPVYRFKVTGIANQPGRELYPSVEVLNRLNPPEGLENEFPIEIVISQSDLEEAIEDRLVTKVIYLENPDTALPHRHLADKQPYLDVGGGEDPLRVARRLGRPMAILRIGSRVPMPSDAGEQFGFNAPEPQLLPSPEALPVEAENATIEPAFSNARPLKVPSRLDTNPNPPSARSTRLPRTHSPSGVQGGRIATPKSQGHR